MATNNPRWSRRVLAAPFAYTAPATRGGYSLTVPAGVLLKPCDDASGEYFVEELAWLKGDAIAHHDATFYGIRVPASATRERGDIPAAATFNAATRTLRSAPGNHWIASFDSWDGAIAHEACAEILARGFQSFAVVRLLAAIGADDAPPMVEQLESLQDAVDAARELVDGMPADVLARFAPAAADGGFVIVKREGRGCFGLHWLASSEEAARYGEHVRARGDTVNGGMLDGMACGRAPEFDGGGLYAVRVA